MSNISVVIVNECEVRSVSEKVERSTKQIAVKLYEYISLFSMAMDIPDLLIFEREYRIRIS